MCALIVKETKTYDPIPEGMSQGVCVGLYDIGTQTITFKGKDRQAKQVIIVWELPEHRIEFEKDDETLNLPRNCSKTFTQSLGKKASLRKYLDGWRGRAFTPEELQGFNLKKVLSVNGLVQIVHNTNTETGNVYANVNAVMPLLKGMSKLQPEGVLRYFEFGESTEIPEGTPEWIVEKIKAAAEWKELGHTIETPEPDMPAFMEEAAPDMPPDEDIPF